MRRRMILLAAVVAAIGVHVVPVARAQLQDSSPASCGADDTPETGIQGDVPRSDEQSGRAGLGYNCGLALVGAFPGGSAVQVFDHCAYVRTSSGVSGAGSIMVIDIADPAAPTQVGVLPTFAPAHGSTSETMRLVDADDRAILVSGSGVYDVRDCEHPAVKGQIPWPGLLPWPAGLSHDIRVSFDGTKVWAGIGVVEADITNLDDPSTWAVTNHTCAVAAQYHPVHLLLDAVGVSQCDVVPDTFPQIGHGPAINDDGTRVYEGNQLLLSAFYPEDGAVRILDTTQPTPRIVSTIPGPGHSIDWFRTADGREYLLHANEIVALPQSTCLPQDVRPWSLGWAHNAYITDITDETAPVRAAEVQLEINSADNCLAKLSSGQNTQVAYHSVDDPMNATFAMISFGDAGLRLFDIRDPRHPAEVAYYNIGAMAHAAVSHYDAARGLVVAAGGAGMLVLELEPQVIEQLGLPTPTDPAYPRFPNGRAARPAPSDGGTTSVPAAARFGNEVWTLSCRLRVLGG